MKPMQMTDVFARLVEIAGSTNGGSRGEVVLSCDLLHQDALYRTQGELASLLADVANACGPVHARVLEQKFPFAFQRREEIPMRNLGTMSVKSIAGYRVQPRMPLSHPYFGATILDAGFIQHPNGVWAVEVKAVIGLNTEPYYLILSIEQARAADIIEVA